ncbi:helix-turn-helix domain-containing protein [Carboxylicivirga linearis]|uniref:Helix-turn-helix domain-containing protein n=1 Tax=Carboxylicivirga linearis TaxID=1628157 RepID=A0ABS5JS41_9BACT|nr:helix-turn-helix domain-containing protein [Carboxylicivirga linearis]MBS2097625.1 helix-turn-helix domain-containing protein [Carboxylicivirga linearis]
MVKNFINRLKQEVLNNIENENFGVSELAEKVGMSRSNLLRRIQKEKGCSASQFIRKIRLEEAMSLLEANEKTVSEVSYMVGFNSTSYFIKCFREQYGYPPGEVNQQSKKIEVKTNQTNSINSFFKYWPYFTAAALLIIAIFIYLSQNYSSNKTEDKSIAVLPFKNDSNDSTNLYFINGLMESVLNNLQSIGELRVVSRTSVEKYRNSKLSAPEIAEGLGVSYIVEGSGQKIGNQILLSIQLIEANKDNHLWSKQYNRQTADIFSIQMEVAKKIANSIEIILKPEEKEQIEQIPTQNIVAYDYYLKGLDHLHKESLPGLREGIELIKLAINEDPEFAHAHAVLAFSYYYLDLFSPNKTYTDSLIHYADKALLFNPKLAVALNAKALYYIKNADYNQAVEYLEKALEYNPNSATVINTLSDVYTNHLPDTKKYLEYALKGIRLDIASYDSSTTSYIYLHLSNALIQTGFVDEALTSIDQSLQYNPDNLFSEYVKAYILYAKNQDLNQTKNLLKQALAKDTNRFDIILEIGNVCYYQQEWNEAAKYFDKFLAIREYMQLQSYIHKNVEMAYVYRKVGKYVEAEKLITDYKTFIEQDQSVYRNLFWSAYYAYMNDDQNTIRYLKKFSEEESIQIWVPLFTPNDPLFQTIKNTSEFIGIMDTIKQQFWQNHKKIKSKLENEGLISTLK